VEPPGTAPGSDPLITSAFMSIVPLPERLEYKGLGFVLEGCIGPRRVGREQDSNGSIKLLSAR